MDRPVIDQYRLQFIAKFLKGLIIIDQDGFFRKIPTGKNQSRCPKLLKEQVMKWQVRQ